MYVLHVYSFINMLMHKQLGHMCWLWWQAGWSRGGYWGSKEGPSLLHQQNKKTTNNSNMLMYGIYVLTQNNIVKPV